MFATMLVVIQLVVSVVVGLYFFRQLRQSRQKEPAHGRESNREMERMRHLRSIHLSEPLAEKVRPTKMSDVIGQEDGIRSLKAILCGANPQHVLIYGPPGIGKTCAARLVLEALGKAPLLTAGLHLGEGTGAVASIPLWDMALAVYDHCYSFAEGGITPYTPQC